MMVLKFRLATAADLPRVAQLIADGREQLRLAQVPQWQDGYPDHATLAADLAAQQLWLGVMPTGTVVVTASIVQGADPNYQVIDGQWAQASDAYLTIHRIAVDHSVTGQGIARQMFGFAANLARERGLAALRVDTHERNLGMRHLIGQLPFKFCGTVQMADGSPRFAYEQVLDLE